MYPVNGDSGAGLGVDATGPRSPTTGIARFVVGLGEVSRAGERGTAAA